MAPMVPNMHGVAAVPCNHGKMGLKGKKGRRLLAMVADLQAERANPDTRNKRFNWSNLLPLASRDDPGKMGGLSRGKLPHT